MKCLYSFRTVNEKVYENQDLYGIVVPSEKDNISEFNQNKETDTLPYIIYADIESVIKKIDGSANNTKKSSGSKLGQRIPWWYSMSTVWEFDHIENKHILYCRKENKKAFNSRPREHARKILNFEKKKVLHR